MAYTIFLVSSLVVSNLSYASMNCYTSRIGNSEYTNCNDNYGNHVSGHTSKIGKSEYSHFSDNHGNHGSCYTSRIGGTTYTNCN
jgi:hypothetical protein